MADQELRIASISNINLRAVTFALVCVVMFAATIMAASAVQAQTFTLLHTFTGGPDGGSPIAGLTEDSAGNLYGTAAGGGSGNCLFHACGTVYKVVHRGSGWLTTPIYSFAGPPDGGTPIGRVILGPDGALYGTTTGGGTGSCSVSGILGCGTVFKLQPPLTVCKSTLCPWRETVLYSFASQSDGDFPQAEIAFDQAGNLYGTTYRGGTGSCTNGQFTGCGTVFKLTHNPDGSWSKSTLYSLQGYPNDGQLPQAGVTLDRAGNIYGTTEYGGTNCYPDLGCGIVFELTPSGSGWTETVLHFFTGGADGNYPYGGLIFDNQGNLYGTASNGGLGRGTVYAFSPGQSGWNFAVLYGFSGNEANSPYSTLTVDAAGSLYGGSEAGGAYGFGTVYKLTPSTGGWIYSTLHSFDSNGSNGFFPEGVVVLDAVGNVYGTASEGPYPFPNAGTIFEITP